VKKFSVWDIIVVIVGAIVGTLLFNIFLSPIVDIAENNNPLYAIALLLAIGIVACLALGLLQDYKVKNDEIK